MGGRYFTGTCKGVHSIVCSAPGFGVVSGWLYIRNGYALLGGCRLSDACQCMQLGD